MIADRPMGVVIQIFVPYKVDDHVISKNPTRIHDEKGKDVKLLCRQFDLLPVNQNQSLLQAEIQIVILNLSQRLFCILHQAMQAGNH